jgi:uncharacterized protein (DUF1330 family)
MPAYVLGDIRVTDPEQYDEYRALAGPSVAQYGGRYLVRGGESEVIEGDRVPGRLVVLEFDDTDAAHRWYDSEEYRVARAAREHAAVVSMIFVDGA